jgi:hypothetical protein
MKTRVWTITLTVKDKPKYSEYGTPEQYISKAELKQYFDNLDVCEAGLVVAESSIKLAGHEPEAPTSRRPRRKQA